MSGDKGSYNRRNVSAGSAAYNRNRQDKDKQENRRDYWRGERKREEKKKEEVKKEERKNVKKYQVPTVEKSEQGFRQNKME